MESTIGRIMARALTGPDKEQRSLSGDGLLLYTAVGKVSIVNNVEWASLVQMTRNLRERLSLLTGEAEP
jgi:hypothetical protein